MATTTYASADSAALSIRFVSLLILVTITTLFATSQYAAAQSCPARTVSAAFSKQSVAVGEEVELVVTITNNSAEKLSSFVVNVGGAPSWHQVDNPMEYGGIFEHFIVMETHSEVGRVAISSSASNSEEESFEVLLDWYLNYNLSLERIAPGASATLRIRLKAVGAPGTVTTPILHVYETGSFEKCFYEAGASINITEGAIAEPLLIQKTLMMNNLFECIRMGEEGNALWQIRNTTDEPRIIRFRDVVPGYLYYFTNIDYSSAFLASNSGTTMIPNAVLSTMEGAVATMQSNTITLPPHTTVHFSNYYDISTFAAPSRLSSPFKVWETNLDDTSSLPPNDAMVFVNPEIEVCEPILTKTGTPSICGQTGEAIIDYEVRIERLIGSYYSPSVFEDLHANGTSFIPTADPGMAGSIREYPISSTRTLWSLSYIPMGYNLEEGADDETEEYNDRLRLRYSASVDNINVAEYTNRFNIYNTHRNAVGVSFGVKAVAGNSMTTTPRMPGNAFTNRNWAAKVADDNGPPIDDDPYDDEPPFDVDIIIEASELVATASHTTDNGCPVIEGYKYNDLNGNGRRDAGEPGVESWMIIAQSSEGTYTAVTDENGYYRMTVPYAAWQVREVYQLGWVQSAPGGEGFYNVAISEQVKGAQLDFGNWRPAVISGVKYHDIDGSASRGNGEPGVEGVRIELRDLSGHVVADTLTDADGYYEFNQVAPGHYAVYEEANPALRQSQPGPKEGGYHYVVTTSGSNHPGKDFGNYEPVLISGSVVQVNAKAAEHDPTVRDFRDLKIQLVRMGPSGEPEPQKAASGTETASNNTFILELDENGDFEANGLQPGDWQASVVLAEFWSAVSSNPVDVFIPSGDAADIGFEVYFDALAAPEVRTSSITGTVFRNTTADHMYNPGVDVKVTGHTVSLVGRSQRGAVVERTVNTNADGIYRFTELPAGNYTVSLGGVADSLKVGWPWADAHRVIIGDDEHVGATFDDMQVDILDADLAWKAQSWSAYGNLWMRIDDDGDAHADRRNFFSGSASLRRTSTNGAWPMVVAHTALQMAGTDSLGRTIRAVSPSGGSRAILSTASKQSAQALGGDIAGHATTQPSTQALGTWTQGLDLNLDLADGLWYGPTASSMSNEPAVVASASVGRWLSIYTPAEFTSASGAGAAPVLRDPLGSPVATVLSARYVITPGPDFGLTPKRFDADEDGDGSGDGDDDGGTGSGDGGIGTSDPDDRANLPKEFALGSAYPNPFNPSTVVPFELAAAGHVNLAVYDVMGRRVATLVNGTMSAGRHTLTWDAAGLPSGVYMVRLAAGGKVMTSKATLLK